MKKMLLTLPLAYLLQDVLNGRLLFSSTSSSSTRNHHPSFLRFWELGRKLSMRPKFVAAQKMLLKQKPSKHS